MTICEINLNWEDETVQAPLQLFRHLIFWLKERLWRRGMAKCCCQLWQASHAALLWVYWLPLNTGHHQSHVITGTHGCVIQIGWLKSGSFKTIWKSQYFDPQLHKSQPPGECLPSKPDFNGRVFPGLQVHLAQSISWPAGAGPVPRRGWHSPLHKSSRGLGCPSAADTAATCNLRTPTLLKAESLKPLQFAFWKKSKVYQPLMVCNTDHLGEALGRSMKVREHHALHGKQFGSTLWIGRNLRPWPRSFTTEAFWITKHEQNMQLWQNFFPSSKQKWISNALHTEINCSKR